MEREEFLKAESLVESNNLLYTNGHKYQSRNAMIYYTGIFLPYDVISDLIIHRRDGWMLVEPYFAWDGCSSIAIDTRTNMRAGHAHDACAALMRKGLLPLSCIEPSNALLRRLMIKDGALRTRANCYKLVLDRTSYWARPENQRPFKIAP